MKLKEIRKIWNELNNTVFANVLYEPKFFDTRNMRDYAQYQAMPAQSEIYFNCKHIRTIWGRSIVYHEMIHQYIEEYLCIEEKNHHGNIFWKNYKKFAPTNVLLFEVL